MNKIEFINKYNLKEIFDSIVSYLQNEIEEISCIIYVEGVSSVQLVDILADELKLNTIEQTLIEVRLLPIMDNVIDIIYDNKDLEDMYSFIKIKEKYLKGEDNV